MNLLKVANLPQCYREFAEKCIKIDQIVSEKSILRNGWRDSFIWKKILCTAVIKTAILRLNGCKKIKNNTKLRNKGV